MTATLAVLVLGDMLAAACDDLGIILNSRDVRRLAPHVVDLLELCGYGIVANGPDACDD